MSEESAEPVGAQQARRPFKTIAFIALMGVVLPIVALVFESTARVFHGAFFDPLPTVFHGVLIATVPLANYMLARSLYLGRALLPSVLPWLQAFAMGVSLLYAILFLPLTPIAPITIIFFGIGLLPLSPLLSLIAAALGRKAFTRMTGARLPFLWRGMALALAAVIALDAPATITRIGLHMATAQAPATRLFGVRWLRVAGSENIMLRHCHQISGMHSGLIGSLLDLHSHIGPEQARSTFYRVTGTPFNSRPAQAVRNRDNWRNAFDRDRGGDVVGQRAAGVSLLSSRMDGTVDANAALGYLEWTMVFKNSSSRQQEGRAEVLLPPGAVVSRATLWIDGEEREAAFGGRSQVRAAYQKVVRQSRDPLLVTTAGPDRVLVQLFPILPQREMKIRIGMTAPMTMRKLHSARLQLPSFSERNFEIDAGLRHAVWVESDRALQGGPGLRSENLSERLFAVRGEVAEPQAGRAATGIEAARPLASRSAWSLDDKGDDGKVIVQTLSERPEAAPHRVAIVIDGSLSMRAIKAQLIDALAAVPAQADVAYVFAGDVRPAVLPHDRANSLASKRYLESLDFEGGRDNGEALGAAWDWAGTMPGGAIVWIHGVQPETSDSIEPLLQRFARRPAQVALYDVEAAPGANAIARKLDGHAIVQRVARTGALDADLRALFAQWLPGAKQVVATRQRQPAGAMEAAAKTSTHLTRLWASTQVATISAKPEQHAAAIAMATRYQLVTPVSGAVVLETKQQYDEAGLEPVAPGSVPTIPEPETWLLIIVALFVLALRYRKRAA